MRLSVLLVLVSMTLACARGSDERSYRLEGQLLAVDATTGEVTIRHEDIPGFMPGMTMPFRVEDDSLAGRARGDLVEATLVLRGNDAWLVDLRKTGEAPLPAATAVPAPGLAPGNRVPDATFTDHHGRRFALTDLDGCRAALTFTYTRCPLPTFCPAIDRRFREVQAHLEDDPALADVRLVSISIDPEYDTPSVLAAHAERVGAGDRWSLVTGTVADVDNFGRQFGLSVTRHSSAPTDLVHNLRTIVLDRQRRIVTVLTGADWTADELMAALRQPAQPSE
jgi:protein SCO1/2